MIPFAPFGRPVPHPAWLEFRERTGIPVARGHRARSRPLPGALRQARPGRPPLIGRPEVASPYVLFQARTQLEANDVAASLAEDGVSHRLWYGRGLQAHAQFSVSSADPLPVTKKLAPRLLGLPFAVDLDERAVDRIGAAVARGLGRR